ncbi:MAG: C4-dicarboxylate ABC transporter substrate-binding protein [Alphaproteobacteria bacterium]
MNRWTIGLAAGRVEGAPLRFAAELARVLDDGDKMRVLPVVTRGIFTNMDDLLYLKGIDTAIIYSDILEELKDRPEIQKNVNYVANLFPAEMHVLVRPEIKTLADLKGKVVNFNTHGTAAAYTGPIVFKRLRVGSINTHIPHPVAIGKMKKGQGNIAGLVFVSSKPLAPFSRPWPKGFHFLRVPYANALKDYYLPSMLTHKDYPNLIPEGQRILTISVPAVLAAFNWKKHTDRYRRMERFTQYFFKRLHVLQNKAGYHPKWKDVNLAAKVPGWNRFPAVTEILKRKKKSRSTVSRKELMQEVLEWRETRGK